jgi:signal transduction histidine kinase
MAAPRAPRKWRPTLAMIVMAVLLSVLILPVAIVVSFRALDHGGSTFGLAEGLALAVALAITVGVGLVFSRTIAGPINALVRRSNAIGQGGRSAIVAPEQLGTRELAALSDSLLDLATRLVDRTEYVSGFAAHVSHELKSPVTAIRGAAELMRDTPMTEDERRRFVDNIIADADRLSALLGRLRELARAELDISAGSTTLADVLGGDAFVVLSGETTVPIALDSGAAGAVFTQLLSNARAHGAKRAAVSAERRDDSLLIRVADDGEGISPGNRNRIFEPFFTTRRETGGTGMGLQIVRALLASHGGTIELVESDRGTTFLLRVPIARLDAISAESA